MESKADQIRLDWWSSLWRFRLSGSGAPIGYRRKHAICESFSSNDIMEILKSLLQLPFYLTVYQNGTIEI